jgi:signal peptidase I
VKRRAADLLVLTAIAIVATVVVKAFLAQAFYIPSESMEPQLHIGDRVVVSRVAYRLHDPRRGDIVVFDSPSSAGSGGPGFPRSVVDDLLETLAVKRPPDTELIKRVIALEGETIEAHDGHVWINGRQLREPYLADGVTTASFGPERVPDDHVFVLGDNRSNSQDSRFIGPVATDSIVGRAIARVWPPGRVAFL